MILILFFFDKFTITFFTTLSKIFAKKKTQKPWETIVISENLNWDEFSKINKSFIIKGIKEKLNISLE